MDRDESLINGPGVQPPASVNVPVPRDVTGDVLRRGVAQVGQNIDVKPGGGCSFPTGILMRFSMRGGISARRR